MDEWDRVEKIEEVDALTGEWIHSYEELPIYPAHEYASGTERFEKGGRIDPKRDGGKTELFSRKRQIAGRTAA